MLVHLTKTSHVGSCSKRWNWTSTVKAQVKQGPEKCEASTLLTLAGISVNQAKWMLPGYSQQTVLYLKSGFLIKDPYSDTKVKTLLEKSYIWNSNTKGSHLLGANVSFELLDIPTSTVLSDAFCSKAISRTLYAENTFRVGEHSPLNYARQHEALHSARNGYIILHKMRD